MAKRKKRKDLGLSTLAVLLFIVLFIFFSGFFVGYSCADKPEKQESTKTTETKKPEMPSNNDSTDPLVEEKIAELISACMDILGDKPLFFQINSYTTGVGKTSIENVLKTTLLSKYPAGVVEADEIGLPIENSGLVLPCGIYGRWFEK